jgi:hypothetical protein
MAAPEFNRERAQRIGEQIGEMAAAVIADYTEWWSEQPKGQEMLAELLTKQGWTCARAEKDGAPTGPVSKPRARRRRK